MREGIEEERKGIPSYIYSRLRGEHIGRERVRGRTS